MIVDSRFGTHRQYPEMLSKWVRQQLKHWREFPEAIRSVRGFIASRVGPDGVPSAVATAHAPRPRPAERSSTPTPNCGRAQTIGTPVSGMRRNPKASPAAGTPKTAPRPRGGLLQWLKKDPTPGPRQQMTASPGSSMVRKPPATTAASAAARTFRGNSLCDGSDCARLASGGDTASPFRPSVAVATAVVAPAPVMRPTTLFPGAAIAISNDGALSSIPDSAQLAEREAGGVALPCDTEGRGAALPPAVGLGTSNDAPPRNSTPAHAQPRLSRKRKHFTVAVATAANPNLARAEQCG